MPFRKKSSTKATSDDASSVFGLTTSQLKALMEARGKDLIEKLNTPEYNGIQGILDRLKVDGSRGLDSNNQEDIQQRGLAFGKNEIPPKPMKSFFKLCWEVLHDMLLLILLGCAVFSIALSFYRAPHEGNKDVEEERM